MVMSEQSVIPQLRMTHAQRSLDFYVKGLGFAIDWEHRYAPGMPLFVRLTRKGQTIFLTEHAGDCAVGGAIYFMVPDVDECFGEFSSRGIKAVEPPTDKPWGAREMVLLDPDGNRLRFGGEGA
jgi:catechol 2,3-dioxygenase-like lactoylglutathione lyase family enzyme